MSPSPYQLGDADQILADFGVDLVITAADHVKRGLLDDVVVGQEIVQQATQSQQRVLKLKRGALAGIVRVQGLVVQFPETGETYTIDQPLPRPTSLFDFYVLQPRRA